MCVCVECFLLSRRALDAPQVEGVRAFVFLFSALCICPGFIGVGKVPMLRRPGALHAVSSCY